ncbi:MAG TPA: cupin fold metalloprotein, WbuC family, partial [Gammaproteobacteria bacterium]|nr:cupin fold metalloprotein, WbuC family [Gammaproteobacteria bacterium]
MKHIDEKVLQELQKRAADSARKRTNLNLHQTLEDPVQRFLNAIEPGSYVRPHRHNTPLRWELFVALSGRTA